jgi:hypothetical protein
MSGTQHGSATQVRFWLPEGEARRWREAAKATGFSNLSEWVRVHMRETVRTIETTIEHDALDE